jgi:hypothetical protein
VVAAYELVPRGPRPGYRAKATSFCVALSALGGRRRRPLRHPQTTSRFLLVQFALGVSRQRRYANAKGFLSTLP